MTAGEKDETMSTVIEPSLLLAPRSSLDLAFGFDSGRTRGRAVAFVLLALALHGGLALGVRGAPKRVVEVVKVTEVELAPPPPPEPEKVAVPEPEQPEAPVAKPSALPPPPQAARAGALLTAKENAPSAKNDELVEFVTDPAGVSYGSGVVARGGTADRGAHGATAAGVGTAPVRAAAAAPPSDGLVAPENLSRRATLNERDACAGFYPSEADADSGAVTLRVIVRADGTVTSSSVVSESPAGQGFGKAARACLQKKRFEPSLDRAGTPVAAATSLKLRFVR
jgi:periplasmic protein TonB